MNIFRKLRLNLKCATSFLLAAVMAFGMITVKASAEETWSPLPSDATTGNVVAKLNTLLELANADMEKAENISMPELNSALTGAYTLLIDGVSLGNIPGLKEQLEGQIPPILLGILANLKVGILPAVETAKTLKVIAVLEYNLYLAPTYNQLHRALEIAVAADDLAKLIENADFSNPAAVYHLLLQLNLTYAKFDDLIQAMPDEILELLETLGVMPSVGGAVGDLFKDKAKWVESIIGSLGIKDDRINNFLRQALTEQFDKLQSFIESETDGLTIKEISAKIRKLLDDTAKLSTEIKDVIDRLVAGATPYIEALKEIITIISPYIENPQLIIDFIDRLIRDIPNITVTPETFKFDVTGDTVTVSSNYLDVFDSINELLACANGKLDKYKIDLGSLELSDFIKIGLDASEAGKGYNFEYIRVPGTNTIKIKVLSTVPVQRASGEAGEYRDVKFAVSLADDVYNFLHRELGITNPNNVLDTHEFTLKVKLAEVVKTNEPEEYDPTTFPPYYEEDPVTNSPAPTATPTATPAPTTAPETAVTPDLTEIPTETEPAGQRDQGTEVPAEVVIAPSDPEAPQGDPGVKDNPKTGDYTVVTNIVSVAAIAGILAVVLLRKKQSATGK